MSAFQIFIAEFGEKLRKNQSWNGPPIVMGPTFQGSVGAIGGLLESTRDTWYLLLTAADIAEKGSWKEFGFKSCFKPQVFGHTVESSNAGIQVEEWMGWCFEFGSGREDIGICCNEWFGSFYLLLS